MKIMIYKYNQVKYDCRHTDHPKDNCICILDSELTFIYKEDGLTISDVKIKINYLPIGEVSTHYGGVHFFDPKNILLKSDVFADKKRSSLILLCGQKASNFTNPHIDYFSIYVNAVYGDFGTIETVVPIDTFSEELSRHWQVDPFNTIFKQLISCPSSILSSCIRYSNGRQLYLTTPGHPMANISAYTDSDAIDNGSQYPSFDSRRHCISHIANYIVDVLETIIYLKYGH